MKAILKAIMRTSLAPEWHRRSSPYATFHDYLIKVVVFSYKKIALPK